MKKPLIYILFVSVILISGCVSTIKPVDPSDITISAAPIEMKEFQEKEISVNVVNNASSPIDSVSVKSLESFIVTSGGNVNIPARTNEPSSLVIIAKIQAQGFKEAANTSMLTLSYESGKDDKGKAIIKTKSIPVKTTVLPDAKLQFVGFVRDLNSTSQAELTNWEANAGDNLTITFSVKNNGKTTIDEKILSVKVEVENNRMGTNNSLIIGNAMARGGTSNTLALQIHVPENAPNGDTDVIVNLLAGDKVIDSQILKLKVKL